MAANNEGVNANTGFLFQNGGFRFGETKEDEELLKKIETGETGPEIVKKKKNRPGFHEDLFCNENGLKLLTKELRKVRFKKNREVANLKRLMRKYKEWSNNLYPQRFEAAIIKFEKLSGKIVVQRQLQDLRDERDGIRKDKDDPMGPPLVHSDDELMQEMENNISMNAPDPFMIEDDIPPDDVIEKLMASQSGGIAPFRASKPALFGAKKPALFAASKPSLFGAKKPAPSGAKKSSFVFGAKAKKRMPFGSKSKPAPPKPQDIVEQDDLDAVLAEIEAAEEEGLESGPRKGVEAMETTEMNNAGPSEVGVSKNVEKEAGDQVKYLSDDENPDSAKN